MTRTQTILLVLDLLGVFAFALSGNLLAARKNIDITGGLLLGALAGLGGGVLRDVMLGERPLALEHPVYLLPPLVSTVLVYFIGRHVERVPTFIVTFDALGLSLFCMTGTVRALDFGMNLPAGIVLGLMTACGGGLLRDVVANEVPAVFNGSDLYLLPALSGSVLTAVAVTLQWWNLWLALLIAALVFVFRMLAWNLQWRVPQPMRGWSYRGMDAKIRVRKSAFRRPRRRKDSREG